MGFNFLQGHHEETVYFFTNESQRVLGTHLIYLGRMKDWVDLEATQLFWPGGPLEWESSDLTTLPLRHTINLVSNLTKGTFSSFLQTIINYSAERTARFINCPHLVMPKNVINVSEKTL